MLSSVLSGSERDHVPFPPSEFEAGFQPRLSTISGLRSPVNNLQVVSASYAGYVMGAPARELIRFPNTAFTVSAVIHNG